MPDEKRPERLETIPANDPAGEPGINFVTHPIGVTVQKPRWSTLILFISLIMAVGGGIRYVHTQTTAPPPSPGEYDPVTLKVKAPTGFFHKLTTLIFSNDPVLEGQKDDRINLLLLGIGGPGHDGPYLSDTITIVSVKPSTREVAFVSIPRDLLIDIPGHGQNKINEVNAFGELQSPGNGGAAAAAIISQTFGISIHYFVRVDFTAFARLVDTVGGITVNVERSFVDPQYPNQTENDYRTIFFTKGVQAMDGKTALMYARSRHGNNGEGSDFARSRRQQKMLLALKEKLLSTGTLTNPIRLSEIMTTLQAHVNTNLTFPDVIALVRLGRDLGNLTLKTLPLDISDPSYLKEATAPNGAYILLPKSGDLTEVKQAIAHIFEQTTTRLNDTPPQTEANEETLTPITEIQNGTWRAGLGARIKKRLTDKNFTIDRLGNTDARPLSASGIYPVTPRGKDALATATNFAHELGISIETSLPSFVKPTPGTDLLIVLGDDLKE